MYGRILVPTDGSDAAMSAAEEAVELAAELGAELHALYVVDVSGVGATTPDAGGTLVQESLTEVGEEAVEAVAEMAREAGLDCTTEVRTGMPHRTIAEYADEADVDLVVMGTHGRSGLEHLLLGSVTEKTVRSSEVPVLTIRPDE